MCGICGILHFENSGERVAERILTEMRETMIHRGPDDAGNYVTDKIGLGIRRLAIIDLKTGHQPIHNEDKTVWVVCNGEIYNYRQLTQELTKRGHKFYTKSDVEAIVHLWEEKGPACVDDLDGEFGFAVWDDRKHELFLARDRLGVKPVYYTILNHALVFASEIKAILKYPGVRREMDPVAMYHYLTFLTTPAPMTLFKGIRKIPAGWCLLIDKNGRIQERQYWDAIPKPDRIREEDEYVEEIRYLLKSSIAKRMLSDVPFGVFLSGGIDSSTNVALMSQLMKEPVRTFTVGYKDVTAYNEFQYARQIADRFKTEHHEILIDHNDFVNYLPDLIYHQDEPIADPVCVPLYYVSKLARDSGTIVVQIGEGSDELFSGYDSYYKQFHRYQRVWRKLETVPYPARLLALHIFGVLWEKQGRLGRTEYLRRLASGQTFFWGGAICFTEEHKKHLLSKKYREQFGGLNSYDVVGEYYRKITELHPESDYLQRMIYVELKLRLPELLLMRADKITMSTSVEGRVPYLDPALVKLVMPMPAKLRIKDQPKYILKKSVEGIIPDNLIYRQKQGFAVPLKEWFGDVLEEFIHETLTESALLNDSGYFDRSFIERLSLEHHTGKRDHSAFLWCLGNLALWHKQWIE